MRATHFKLYELLPPECYSGEDKGWELLDDDLIRVIDWTRELVGLPLTANTWRQGGTFRYRGFRPRNCGVGASRSAHKDGMACDLVCSGMSAARMRDLIAANMARLPHPVRIERDVTWLHIDVKTAAGAKKITYFKG